jgi:hypothetical protein
MLDEIRAGKILRSAQNDTCGIVILNEVKDLILKLSHYQLLGHLDSPAQRKYNRRADS